MSVLGEGFIRIRPLGDTFEAESKRVVQGSLKNLAASSKNAATETEKAFNNAGKSVKTVGAEIDNAATKSGGAFQKIKGLGSNLLGNAKVAPFTDAIQKKLKGLDAQSGTTAGITKQLIGTLGQGGAAVEAEGEAAGAAATGGMAAFTAATAGIVLAVGATIAFLAKGVQAFSAQTAEVRKFKLVAGGTAEEDSKLVATLQELGVQPAIVSRGFFLLSKNLDANKKKFDDLGIVVARNKDGTIDLNATLLNVSDTYNKATDQATKNQIAFTAFGRAGQSLIPVLAAGRDRLAELNAEAAKKGLVFSEEDLKKGKEFGIATRALSESEKGLAISASRELVPALTKWLQYMASIVDEGNQGIQMIDRMIDRISKIPIVGTAVKAVEAVFKRMTGSSQKAAQALDEQAQSSEDAKNAAEALSKAEQATADASSQLIDKAFAVADAQKAVRDINQQIKDQVQVVTRAEEDQTTAKNDLAKAQKAYSELVKAGGADLNAYKKATDDVRNAEQALKDSRNGVLDALDNEAQKQYDLNVAIGEFGPLSQQAMKAQTDLRDAHEGVGKANNDVLNSQEELTQAQKDQKDASAGSKASEDRLTTARDNLRDATRKEQDAEKSLRDERQKQIDQAPEQQKAYLALAKASADQRETQLLAAGATQDSIDKNQIYKDKLLEVAGGLDPNGQLRKNLQGYTKDLLDNGDAAKRAADFAADKPTGVVVKPGASTNPNPLPPLTQGLIAPLGLPRKAAGGSATGWTMVGEQGPELAYFGQRGYVQDSRATSRAGGGDMQGLIDAVLKLAAAAQRPSVNLGPFTNTRVDPLALAQRIAFETAPAAAP